MGSAAPLAVGFLVMIGLVAHALSGERALESRAHRNATGTVTGKQPDDFVLVHWSDATGADHSSRYQLEDASHVRVGDAFAVRYEPGRPGNSHPSADEGPYTRADDLEGGLTVLIAGLVILLLLTPVRLVQRRRGRRAPTTPALALPIVLRNSRSPLSTTWLALWPSGAAPGTPAAAAFPVLWAPQVRSWGAQPRLVDVHGQLTTGRLRVVDTPVGELLAVGRVRRKKLPEGRVLPPLPVPVPDESSLRDESGFPVVEHPWWRPPLVFLGIIAFPVGAAVVSRAAQGLELPALLLLAPTAGVWACGFFATTPDAPTLRDDALVLGEDPDEDDADALARIGRELDLTVRRRVVHELVTTSRERADALGAQLAQAGYEVEVDKIVRGEWVVSGARVVVVDLPYLEKTKRELDAISALQPESSYDGWYIDDPAHEERGVG